jgi:hypothetical protein
MPAPRLVASRLRRLRGMGAAGVAWVSESLGLLQVPTASLMPPPRPAGPGRGGYHPQ